MCAATLPLFDASPAPGTRELLVPGAWVLRGFALDVATELLAEIERIAALSPFRHLVTPGGKTIVYREWPDVRRFGEWALSPADSEDGGGRRNDWRVGPAQRVGLLQGINEIKRMILEEEGWVWDAAKQAWDGSHAEQIERRLIDPRLGAEGIPSMDEGTSIIDLMELEGHDGRMVLAPMFWEAAPASHVSEGVGLLNEQMAFDGDRPVGPDNCPKWYVVDDLEQTLLASDK